MVMWVGGLDTNLSTGYPQAVYKDVDKAPLAGRLWLLSEV